MQPKPEPKHTHPHRAPEPGVAGCKWSTHTNTHTPTPQPGVAGRSRKPSPNTHTHTAHPCQEWLGASGARTRPHTHPNTPARRGGAQPKAEPKHTHPRRTPQPGVAGCKRRAKLFYGLHPCPRHILPHEAGSDPRGHLWVTWGVYLCAGKPPLADIILSYPPDLTRCDSVIGLAIPAMSGHIQY